MPLLRRLIGDLSDRRYALANFLAALVLALLIIDPTRDLTPVFVLLALAVALVLAARWVPGR